MKNHYEKNATLSYFNFLMFVMENVRSTNPFDDGTVNTKSDKSLKI